MTEEKILNVVASASGRVDKVLSMDDEIPRSIFSKKSTKIRVNGVEVKKSFPVKEGDEVELEYTEELFSGVKGEDIGLDVLYEDDQILVIDKKPGMVVHPGAGVHSGTLVNALVHRYGEEILSSDPVRPGIVHRLDKDTSGVMVIAKTRSAHEVLADAFKNHDLRKEYVAVVEGTFKEKEGLIEKNIVRSRSDRKKYTTSDSDGRYALTKYKVIGECTGYSLLAVEILTGRTHQIRVHMKSISHPIAGDAIYNPKSKVEELMLHSRSLEIKHPGSGERMIFTSKVPERFSLLFPKEVSQLNEVASASSIS